MAVYPMANDVISKRQQNYFLFLQWTKIYIVIGFAVFKMICLLPKYNESWKEFIPIYWKMLWNDFLLSFVILNFHIYKNTPKISNISSHNSVTAYDKFHYFNVNTSIILVLLTVHPLYNRSVDFGPLSWRKWCWYSISGHFITQLQSLQKLSSFA